MERVLARAVPEADRGEALAELRVAMDAFAQLEEVWRRLHGGPPLVADVAGRLDSYIARAVDESQPAARSKDAVQLLTVHQSKGLQFEVVFLSGFAEGV